jgi:ferredoxin
VFISIDATRCTGHGRCYTVAYGLLTEDDEGYVAERGRTWQLRADQVDVARDAANACPESAITVRDGDA